MVVASLLRSIATIVEHDSFMRKALTAYTTSTISYAEQTCRVLRTIPLEPKEHFSCFRLSQTPLEAILHLLRVG